MGDSSVVVLHSMPEDMGLNPGPGLKVEKVHGSYLLMWSCSQRRTLINLYAQFSAIMKIASEMLLLTARGNNFDTMKYRRSETENETFRANSVSYIKIHIML